MERNGRILNAFEKEILERVERIERHLGLDPIPARLRQESFHEIALGRPVAEYLPNARVAREASDDAAAG